MSCKIQKPTSQNQRHGKLIVDITCNGETNEPVNFDATKGDLKLHLICEENEETNSLQVLNDKDAINDIYSKLKNIQTQINEINDKIK